MGATFSTSLHLYMKQAYCCQDEGHMRNSSDCAIGSMHVQEPTTIIVIPPH
jgi:hypothetical protein